MNDKNSKFWSNISTKSLIRFLLFSTCGWVLLQAFSYFEYVIFVFTFAAILALLLNYPVQYLERFIRRGFARGIVIGFSLLIVLVILVFLGLTISVESQKLVNTITESLSSSDYSFTNFQDFLKAKKININLEQISEQVKALLSSGIVVAANSLPSLLNNFFTLLIILIISFFMLIDGERLWQLLLKLIPANQRSRVATAIQDNLLGFLRAKFLTSLFLGIAALIGFILLKIPSSFLLAIIFGVFNLIPGIGGPLAGLLITLIVLIQSGWQGGLTVLVACSILQQLESIISPRLMQSTINLNPVVVFLALLLGAKIAGLLGIFLSVPIAGVIASLLGIEEMKSN
jgi:predicted PurR-regulated permease PerM